jgi:hypothetical protein
MKLIVMAFAMFAIAVVVSPGSEGVATSSSAGDGMPRYDAQNRLVMPADYREWIFLSSGIDMNYSEGATPPERHLFGNVFAPRAAYLSFKQTGIWPDKTVLILEDRLGSSHGSINKAGRFQTTKVVGLEAHVKDVKRFGGGWGFFIFDGSSPAELSTNKACYECHIKHAAADTTFVQFYPTLLPVAQKLKTLSPAYIAATAAENRASPTPLTSE